MNGREARPAAASTAPRASATPSAVFLLILKKRGSMPSASGVYVLIAAVTARDTQARRSSGAPLSGSTQLLQRSVGRDGLPSMTAIPSRSYPGSIANILITTGVSED